MATSAEQQPSAPDNATNNDDTTNSNNETSNSSLPIKDMNALSLDDRVPESEFLGKANDAEVDEVSRLFTKMLSCDDVHSKPEMRKESHLLKGHFNKHRVNPLDLLQRRGKQKPQRLKSLNIHDKGKGAVVDVLKFDEVLGLVNEIERDHLKDLQRKVMEEKKAQQAKAKKDNDRLKKLVYEHFKKSRGLVKKIKHIQQKKKRQRARGNQSTPRKRKRYRARCEHKQTVKSRKKRLRRQALHQW